MATVSQRQISKAIVLATLLWTLVFSVFSCCLFPFCHYSLNLFLYIYIVSTSSLLALLEAQAAFLILEPLMSGGALGSSRPTMWAVSPMLLRQNISETGWTSPCSLSCPEQAPLGTSVTVGAQEAEDGTCQVSICWYTVHSEAEAVNAWSLQMKSLENLRYKHTSLEHSVQIEVGLVFWVGAVCLPSAYWNPLKFLGFIERKKYLFFSLHVTEL